MLFWYLWYESKWLKLFRNVMLPKMFYKKDKRIIWSIFTSVIHLQDALTSLTLRGRPFMTCLLTFSTAFFMSSSVLNSTTLFKKKKVSTCCAKATNDQWTEWYLRTTLCSVSKPARMNKNKTGTRETIRQAPQEINENWLRKNTSDTKFIKNNHIICLCGVQQLHNYIQTQNGWQDQLMTRIHKRPSAPITHSGSISVIPLVESLNKSLTPCLVTEHHLKSNNETVQKNATS